MARTKNVQKLIVVDGEGEGHGILTGWAMHGPARFAELTQAWERDGHDPKLLRDLPTPEAILGRIILGLSSTGIDRRKLPRGSGWAIVDVSFDAQNLPVYADTPRVVATLVGRDLRLTVNTADGRDTTADRVRQEYERGMSELGTTDCSSWFVGLMRKHDGVPVLRENGGVYYIPPAYVTSWQAIVKTIEDATHHSFGEIPAMSSEKGVQTILRGLASEVKSEGEKLQIELQKVLDGDKKAISVETIAARETKIADLTAKLLRYEACIGRSDDAYNVVANLKSNLLTTMRYAVGKAQGRDMDAPRLLDLDDRPIAKVATAQVTGGAVDRFSAIGEEVRKETIADPTPKCGKLTPEYDGVLFPVKPCVLGKDHSGSHCPRA